MTVHTTELWKLCLPLATEAFTGRLDVSEVADAVGEIRVVKSRLADKRRLSEAALADEGEDVVELRSRVICAHDRTA